MIEVKQVCVWEGIHVEILVILNIDLPLDPLYCIIGEIPNGSMEKRRAYIFHIFYWWQKKDNFILAQTTATHPTSVAR